MDTNKHDIVTEAFRVAFLRVKIAASEEGSEGMLVRELGEISSTWKVQKVLGASAVELG